MGDYFMKKKVLAIASGGGHWVQLLKLRAAFAGHEVQYLTTHAGYRSEVDGLVHVVTDANMWQKLRLLIMFFEVLKVLLIYRPDVVITTGAAPGFAAIMMGRILGARTIWVDSIANSEELSSSGRHARRWASAWLTQWEHLAGDDGPEYWGAIL
ncbi:Oligosaccharide biosynthesis protein Alg14 like protein [compost metagenome]